MKVVQDKETKKVKESKIQKEILKYLKEQGFFAIKVPVGPMMVHSGKKMFMAPNQLKGFPDILVFSRQHPGKIFCIEVKSATGSLRPEQKMWFARLESLGVPCSVCRSVEDAKQMIEVIEKDPGVYPKAELPEEVNFILPESDKIRLKQMSINLFRSTVK